MRYQNENVRMKAETERLRCVLTITDKKNLTNQQQQEKREAATYTMKSEVDAGKHV
jgi:hypothetical protein